MSKEEDAAIDKLERQMRGQRRTVVQDRIAELAEQYRRTHIAAPGEVLASTSIAQQDDVNDELGTTSVESTPSRLLGRSADAAEEQHARDRQPVCLHGASEKEAAGKLP